MGGILERSAKEDAPSPSIQQAMVQNSDAAEVDDQAVEPHPPIRIAWPVPVPEVPPEAAETDIFAKNKTVRLVRAEAEARTTDDTSTVQRERTAVSPRETPSVVFLFLSLALPGAGILAWLLIRADTNKRLVDRLDDQRQADWIDDFLANRRQSLTTRNSVFASTRKVQPSTEEIEAALREFRAISVLDLT